MAFGELDEPRGYSKHLAAIRRRARDLDFTTEKRSPTRIDGERTYDCGICPEDSGLVTIYHPRTVAAVMAGKTPDVLQTCVCACSCANGGSKAESLRLPRYSVSEAYRTRDAGKIIDAVMVSASTWLTRDDQLAEIESGVEEFQGRNRVAAFDQWNASASVAEE